MSPSSRRRFVASLAIGTFTLAAGAQAPSQGVVLRFRVLARTRLPTGDVDSRSYENAALVAFGERFSAEIGKEFRIALRPRDEGTSVGVQVELTDLQRPGAAAGHASAAVPFGGEASLALNEHDARSFSVVLRATRAALPGQKG